MTPELECNVADIVKAAGGRLVSRIRMQKIAYLLDQLGGSSGFSFEYHHYGPYSRELDSAILDAKAFGLVNETFENRKSDGARYSVFTSTVDGEGSFSYLQDGMLRSRVKHLVSEDITVLELAATAHWLVHAEKIEDWRSEIGRRKGAKIGNGRLEKATALLARIGLQPASV